LAVVKGHPSLTIRFAFSSRASDLITKPIFGNNSECG